MDIEADDECTDVYDEIFEPIEAKFVSRLVFYIIVEGINNKGFKKYRKRRLKTIK